MDKGILTQYCDICEEILDLDRRIKKTEREIDGLEIVSDTVSGSRRDLTIGPISIKGYPSPEYYRKKFSLERNIARMTESKKKLEGMREGVEEYIETIPDSRMRRIMRFKFLDGLTWREVAIRMGKISTEESVRKEYERYFAK